MKRLGFTLATLALVASGFTLRATNAFAAHGQGGQQSNGGTSNASSNAAFTASLYTINAMVAGEFSHTYIVGTNPFCSGATTTGTGSTPAGSYYYTNEAITSFAFNGSSLSFATQYLGPYNAGYSYSVSNAAVTQTGTSSYSFSGVLSGTSLPVTGTIMGSTQSFANRGAYIQSLSSTQRAVFESAACATSGSTEGSDDDESTSGSGDDSDGDENTGGGDSGDDQGGD